MQEPDVVERKYWSDCHRFADVMNVGMFCGKAILTGEMLADENGFAGTTIKKSRKISAVSKYRDIIKRADFGGRFVLIGIENQADIHYAMPVRIMGYDYLGYDKQIQKIRKKHRKEKDLQGAEWLSGFAKTDKLDPIFTLCLYWGERPWDGPKTLHELLQWEGIPLEVQKMVVDYPMHILDVRRFNGSEELKTDVRILFGFLQRQNDSKALSDYIEKNKADFSEMDEDTYDMISVLANFKELESVKEIYKNKDGEENMCEAFEQWKKEWKAEGIETGIEAMVQDYLEEGFTKERIMSKLEKRFSISPEKAEEYFERFSKVPCKA